MTTTPAPDAGNGSIEVRAATDTDVPGIAVLFRHEAELHQELDGGFRVDPGFDWEGAVLQLMAASHRRFWVAAIDGSVAGFLYARIVRPSAAVVAARPSLVRRLKRILKPPKARSTPLQNARTVEPFGIIEDVFVDPRRRRSGVGAGLVAASTEWFGAEGLRSVVLEVSVSNDAAVRFWRRHGFEVYRHRMRRALA